jgi:hypothetical protein
MSTFDSLPTVRATSPEFDYPLALGTGFSGIGVLEVETEVDNGQEIGGGGGLDLLNHGWRD